MEDEYIDFGFDKKTTRLYGATYGLALISIFLIAFMQNNIFSGAIFIAALSAGFLGNWFKVYRQYLENPFVKWGFNIAIILAMAMVLPITMDGYFTKRCFTVLGILNIAQSFMMSTKRDVAFSQIISVMIIILAPPFILKGVLAFGALIILAFSVLMYIFILSSGVELSKDAKNLQKSDINIPSRALFLALSSFFVFAVAFLTIFGLMKIQIPFLIIPPYDNMDKNYIDYFDEQSRGSIENPHAKNKYTTENRDDKKWLIASGNTDKVFSHGIMPSESNFGNAVLPKDTAEEIQKNNQEKLEKALYGVSNFMWHLGIFLIFLLFALVLSCFLTSIIKSRLRIIKLKEMVIKNPTDFVKNAYQDCCQALGAYAIIKPAYMTSEEYLGIVKYQFSSIADEFTAITDKFQEALYSGHLIGQSASKDIYCSYTSILNYLSRKKFSIEYISWRLKSRFEK